MFGDWNGRFLVKASFEELVGVEKDALASSSIFKLGEHSSGNC